jgi:hypothetical protein
MTRHVTNLGDRQPSKRVSIFDSDKSSLSLPKRPDRLRTHLVSRALSPRVRRTEREAQRSRPYFFCKDYESVELRFHGVYKDKFIKVWSYAFSRLESSFRKVWGRVRQLDIAWELLSGSARFCRAPAARRFACSVSRSVPYSSIVIMTNTRKW